MFKQSVILTLAIVALLALGGVGAYTQLKIKGAEQGMRQDQASVATLPEPSSGIDTSNWKTYRNEQYGFEVKYPSSWVMTEGGGEIVQFWKFGSHPSIIPKEEQTSNEAKVAVIIFNNHERLTLEEYIRYLINSGISPQTSIIEKIPVAGKLGFRVKNLAIPSSAIYVAHKYRLFTGILGVLGWYSKTAPDEVVSTIDKIQNSLRFEEEN